MSNLGASEKTKVLHIRNLLRLFRKKHRNNKKKPHQLQLELLRGENITQTGNAQNVTLRTAASNELEKNEGDEPSGCFVVMVSGLFSKKSRNQMKRQNQLPLTLFSGEENCTQAQDVLQPLIVRTTNETAENKEHIANVTVQERSVNVQERRVIQHSFSTEKICHTNDKSNDADSRLKVFIVHTESDSKFADELANLLRSEGCLVTLFEDIKGDIDKNTYREAMEDMLHAADFIVPLVTKDFKNEIDPPADTAFQGNSVERDARRYLHKLMQDEFRKTGRKRHRSRPVCPKDIVRIEGDDIMRWIFPERRLAEKLIKDKVDLTQEFKAKDKVALLIGNQVYFKEHNLDMPIKDTMDLAEKLQSMNFKVILAHDPCLQGMKDALQAYCSLLFPNFYGFVYFAGHGLEKHGQIYPLPIDYKDPIQLEDCLCVMDILAAVQKREPDFNAIVPDNCRIISQETSKNTETEDNLMKKNTIIVYPTVSSKSAKEWKEKEKEEVSGNSFLIKYLKEVICEKQSIVDNIRDMQKNSKDEKRLNVEYSSTLARDFYLYDSALYCSGPPWKIILHGLDNSPETHLQFQDFKCSIILNLKYVDSNIFIETLLVTEEGFNPKAFHNVKFNIELSKFGFSEDLSLYPTEGIPLEAFDRHKIPLDRHKILKKKVCQMCQVCKKCQFGKKSVIDLNIVDNQFLKGFVIFKKGASIVQEAEFCIWMKKTTNSPMTYSML